MTDEIGSRGGEQEWRHPWELLGDDGVGQEPVEVVITGDDSPAKEDVTEQNQPAREHLGAAVAGEVVEHEEQAVAPKAAVEGEIVLNRNRGSTTYYDQPLAEAKKVCIVGDASSAKSVDVAVYQIAQTIAENVDPSKGNGVIIAARFAPAPDTYLMKPPEQHGKSFEPVAVSATGAGGLYSVLKGDQLAEAVATAAGGDNDRVVTTYNYILSKVTQALTTQQRSEMTGETTTTPPTLEQIRDGMRWLREQYTTDITTIDKGQRDAVKDSIPKTTQAEVRPYFEPLGEWLDKAIPHQAATPQTSMEQPLADGTTLINIGVDPTGHGLQAKAEKALLSQALIPLIAQQTPWGRPEAVILTDVDQADPNAIREIDRICRVQGIPLVITVGAIPEQFVDIVQSDIYGITSVNPLQANTLSNKVLGTTMREDATSRTSSIGRSEGTSASTGGSESFKSGGYFSESVGTSTGDSYSDGATYGVSESVSINEGPRFRAAELGQIPQGKIALISSAGDSYGLYNIGERNRAGEFPPSPPRPQLDVSDKMRGIGGQQQSGPGIITPASAPPSIDYKAAARSAGPELTPASRRQELTMRYNDATGNSARGGGFERWCRAQWASEQEGRTNIVSWDQWQVQNGLKRPK